MIEVCCKLYKCKWNVNGSCTNDYIGIGVNGKAECFEGEDSGQK